MRGAAFACLASLTLTCLAQETKIDLNKSQTFGALPTQVQATGEKGETVKLNILCYEGYVTKKSALEFAQRMKNKFHRNILISFQNIEDEDKIFDSLRSGDHDIISPGIDLYQDERFQLIEKKFLLPIDLDLVSNYKNLFAFRKKMNFLMSGGQSYGIPFVSGVHGLMYNKSAFKVPPTSFKELLDPKNGTYSITNYPSHLAYMIALMTGHRGDAVFKFDKLMSEKTFVKNFAKVVRGAQHIMPGVDQAKEMMTNNLAIGFGFAIDELKAGGQEWALADTREGHIGWLDSWSLAQSLHTNPFKTNLAHEFLNFVLSPEYQAEYVVRGLSSEPVNEKTLALLTEQDFLRMPRLKNVAHWEKNRTYIRPMTIRDRNGFRLLFSRQLTQQK